MDLKSLVCLCNDIDIDKYLEFYKKIRSNMQYPQWLGDFKYEDIKYILNSGGKIWLYCFKNEIICSFMYLPADQKFIESIHLNLNFKYVGECGPIMVHPNYRGLGLQRQMLNELDQYCNSQNLTHILTTIHKDNICSILNFKKCNYEYKKSILTERGNRDLYIKRLNLKDMIK